MLKFGERSSVDRTSSETIRKGTPFAPTPSISTPAHTTPHDLTMFWIFGFRKPSRVLDTLSTLKPYHSTTVAFIVQSELPGRINVCRVTPFTVTVFKYLASFSAEEIRVPLRSPSYELSVVVLKNADDTIFTSPWSSATGFTQYLAKPMPRHSTQRGVERRGIGSVHLREKRPASHS